jgi:hypothetical protein
MYSTDKINLQQRLEPEYWQLICVAPIGVHPNHKWQLLDTCAKLFCAFSVKAGQQRERLEKVKQGHILVIAVA